MSKADIRLPLAAARDLAEELAGMLGPFCDRIEIAGSIRREKPDCGDIELVCIPRIEVTSVQTVPNDLFGEPVEQTQTVNNLDVFCQRMLDKHVFELRPDKTGATHWGPSLKTGRYKGFGIDVTSADAETWGYWYTIRTGDADFSHLLVTPRRQSLFIDGIGRVAGLCPSYLHFKDKRLRRADGTVIPTPEEGDIFRELGLEMIPPPLRSARLPARYLVTT